MSAAMPASASSPSAVERVVSCLQGDFVISPCFRVRVVVAVSVQCFEFSLLVQKELCGTTCTESCRGRMKPITARGD